MAKDRYEISLWDDIFVSANGNIPGHYEEQKIAVIGSDSMTTQCRAIEPRFVQNINGKNTLTFRMFYVYHDELTDEEYQNPFLNLLVNERKVKVRWRDEWYDLIVKNIQEASNGKSIIYTCEDANINELARSGFELIFDDDLNKSDFTNQGTAQELAQYVVEGTDWVVDTENSDTVQQFNEESTLEITLTSNVSAIDQTTGASVTIPSGALILVYYSQVADLFNAEDGTYKDIVDLQFAYAEKYSRETNSELVVNAHCYKVNSTCRVTKRSNGLVGISIKIESKTYIISSISERYRAKRLVETPKTVIDAVTGKTCYVYRAPANGTGIFGSGSKQIRSGDLIYKYIGSEFGTANYVANLIANPSAFLSTDGWSGDASHSIGYTIYPLGSFDEVQPDKSYLVIPTGSAYYYNDAMRSSAHYFKDGVKTGEKYILRFKIKVAATTDGNVHPGTTYCGPSQFNTFQPIISTIRTIDGYKQPENRSDYLVTYFTSSAGVKAAGSDWLEFTLTCQTSFSGADIYSKSIGLFLNINTAQERYIEEVEFFKYVEGTNQQRINPGDFDIEGMVNTTYVYYNHTKYGSVLSTDDIDFLYSGTEDWNRAIGDNVYLSPVVNENFCKIRSITAKNSNRFNILQSIAETFQCWIKFEVAHNPNTGALIYTDGVPSKKIKILNDIGVERGVGFVYGIDLQTISRTIESNSIVTKTIVGANDNEFGKNGTCRISRSIFNIPRVDYIYNFDYYINHYLLDGNELNRDLYLKTGTDEAEESQKSDGFYYWMNKWNLDYESKSEAIAHFKVTLSESEARLDAYKKSIDAATETIQQYQRELCKLSNNADAAYDSVNVQAWIEDNLTDERVAPRLAAIASQRTLVEQYERIVVALNTAINGYTTQIQTLKDECKVLESYIKNKSVAFYKKYARFISEGSWIDQKYSDDDSYFLDATSVAYTSSRPKVTYNISVLRLTGLEGYELKDFSLGDIAFVQDTEFFGYTYPIINNVKVKTPYKEQVLITEITFNFDDPSKDSFKVQNYKTQFEDLFQRITATTQSLQYATGSYAKAAGIVEADGTINQETLAASISVSSDILNHTSLNQSVISDEQGITVTDLNDPSKVVRITAGGIFISTDGGTTWKNAVRGEGVSTQYLTTGSINTSNIQILDGAYAAFRWDNHGISAYDSIYADENQTNIIGYNVGKFVRFDHFGIYGLESERSSEYVPQSESQIWDDAKFGLTWDGFFVKNRYTDHYVEVSSTNDIQVVDTSGANNVVRVKIGELGNGEYGFRIADNTGTPVLETNSTGQLWLENALYVARSSSSYDVAIGALPTSSYAANSAGASQVFNATDKFIVYEDGSFVATDAHLENAYVEGTIVATGGSIGNMTIESLELIPIQINELRTFEIESQEGYNFVVDDSVATPSSITLQGVSHGFDITSGTQIRWEGSTDFSNWTNYGTGLSKTFTYSSLASNFVDSDIYHIKATYSSNGDFFVAYATLTQAKHGVSPLFLQIDSSSGNLFVNHDIGTELIATVWRGTEDVTSQYNGYFKWTQYDEDGLNPVVQQSTTNRLLVTHTNILRKAKFTCEIVDN